MQTKLILCDLDGTLLRSDKTVSQRTAAALRKSQSLGIPVGFATSRGRANVSAWEAQLAPDVLICNGGACVFYKDALLFSAAFTQAETRALLSAAYRVCGASAEITVDVIDRVFWNRKADKSTDYDRTAAYDDFTDFHAQAMKICVQTADRRQAAAIAAAAPDCDFLPFSDIPWHKFSPRAGTKENAVRLLCAHLRISPQNVVAFGDDHSDIGMLRLCGTGVAMQNAVLEAKQAADAVTASNDDDGVAAFLERLLQSEAPHAAR